MEKYACVLVNVVKLLMNLLLTPISDLGRNNCDEVEVSV